MRPLFGTLLVLASLAVPHVAAAESLVEPSSEATFERSPTVEGRSFLCLGAGIRKRAFFKVYALSFCIEAETGRSELAKFFTGPGKQHAGKRGDELAEALAEDPEFFRFVVQMPVAKLLEMVFLRDVNADQIRSSFEWSLTQILGPSERYRIEPFAELVTRDVKEGEKLALRTDPEGELAVQLDHVSRVRDERVAWALWQTYFGPDAPSPTLKEAVARGVASLLR